MFTVNGITWHIKFVSPSSRYLHRSDGSSTVGCTDRDTFTVYVSDEIYGDFLKKVLCHEITHCYIFSYNIYLNVEQEEMVCDILATYGKDIIRITDEIYERFNRQFNM